MGSRATIAPFLVAESLLGRALQLRAHGEKQVPAGNRVTALQHAQNPPLGVGLDSLITDLAVQPIFIGRLDTRLADMGRSPIVGVIDTFELALVDAADIPDEMDAEFPLRVVAGQSGTDVDSREAVAVDRESCDLAVIEPQAQRNFFETALSGQGSQEFLFVRLGDRHDLAQFRDQRIDVVDHLGNHLEAIGRQVLGQNFALAVEDEPTRGRNRDDLDPVVLRQRGEVLMLEYLEMGEPSDEYEREYCDDDRRIDGAHRQQVRLARGILDRKDRRHRRSVPPIRIRMSP